MKRRPGQEPRDGDGLTSEDRRIWGRVTGTVTPPRKRKAARVQTDAAHVEVMAQVLSALEARPTPKPAPKRKASPPAPRAQPLPASPRPAAAPEDVEPNRKRRLTRERDPIEARIDLHGFGRFEAEDQLRAFLTSCQGRGMRAVLVITGQGRLGGGVIRASFADWMHAPALRSVVSGYTVAHQRHGGNGAFYVTLRRKA